MERLRGIVELGDLSTDPVDLICYSRDASENIGMADAVVFVTKTSQVSEIVKLANIHRFPVVPRGAGTSLSGGPIASEGGVIIDLSKMNKILEVNVKDMQCLVESGVVVGDLNRELARYGYFLPPTPASEEVCTIGGCLAVNASGLRGFRYGTMKDWVQSLEVVLPTGSIIEIGSKTRKWVSGYDLPRLIVGSEGTLGIITKALLRIHPLPEARRVVAGFFGSIVDACKTVNKLIMSNIDLSGIEILDNLTLNAISGFSGMAFPECEVALFVEVHGLSRHIGDNVQVVQKLFSEQGAIDVRVGTNEEENEKVWAARKDAFPALGALKPTLILEDVTVPTSMVCEMFRTIQRISKKYGVTIAIWGHAGDGNLHPVVMFNERKPEEVKRAKETIGELFRAALKLGGTLTGEHGIGLSKIPYIPLEFDEETAEVMRKIKKAFDPYNVLNPGKMGV